jgi:hypothetical protein
MAKPKVAGTSPIPAWQQTISKPAASVGKPVAPTIPAWQQTIQQPQSGSVKYGTGSYGDQTLGVLTNGGATSQDKFLADVAAAKAALAKGISSGSGNGSNGSSGGSGGAYASAMAQALSGYNTGRQDIINQGNMADSDLQQIFLRLGQRQRELQSDAIKGFRANGQRLGSTYDDLLHSIGANYSQGGNALANELSRLGIQAAGPGASEGLVRDSAFATNQARIDKSNSLSNNSTLDTMIINLMTQNRMASQSEGASQRAQNKQKTNDALRALAQQLAAQKAQIASASRSGGGGGGRGGSGGGGKKSSASSKQPKGLQAALEYIKAHGGSPSEIADLQAELRFSQTAGALSDQLGHVYGKAPDGTPQVSGIANWQKQGKPYGQTQADLVATALAILNGKY